MITEPNPYRCKHREQVCHAVEPCKFQEFADDDVGIVFCGYRSTSEVERIVYSRTITKPNLPAVKYQMLALKEVEKDGQFEEYSWASLNFKLEIGDKIQIIREGKKHSIRGRM